MANYLSELIPDLEKLGFRFVGYEMFLRIDTQMPIDDATELFGDEYKKLYQLAIDYRPLPQANKEILEFLWSGATKMQISLPADIEIGTIHGDSENTNVSMHVDTKSIYVFWNFAKSDETNLSLYEGECDKIRKVANKYGWSAQKVHQFKTKDKK